MVIATLVDFRAMPGNNWEFAAAQLRVVGGRADLLFQNGQVQSTMRLTPDDREMRAEARLALEDARAAHQAHDIDTARASLATAGIFDVDGDALWFPARQRGPRGEELRTTDPKAARYLPQWLWTRTEFRKRKHPDNRSPAAVPGLPNLLDD
jgi:hypothetical protein